MLELNLNKLNEVKTITSNDEDFKGTQLEGTGFEIDIKALSKTERTKTILQVQDLGFEDKVEGIALNEKFTVLAHIKDIRGITVRDSEGNEFEDKADMLKAFYEVMPDEISNAITKAINGFNKSEEDKKKDSEIVAETSQDGMLDTQQ